MSKNLLEFLEHGKVILARNDFAIINKYIEWSVFCNNPLTLRGALLHKWLEQVGTAELEQTA